MEQENIYDIIGLVLSGTANEYEKELLKSWLEESPDNIRTYRILEQAWKNSRLELSYSHEEEQYQKVISRIQSPAKSRWTGSKNFLRIAASVSLLFLCGWIVYMVKNSSNEVKPVEREAYIVKSTPAGSKLKFILPDGTAVWLNAESTLKYNHNYGVDHRRVELIGEAYFEVVKDKVREFVVSSSGFRTTALGTSFNIRAFQEKVNISLVEGKVRIDQYRKDSVDSLVSQMFLFPGEQASWFQERNILEKKEFDPMKVTAWKDNILYFEDADFHDIIERLESWYGVKFNVINPPKKYELLFSGKFHNKSLKHVLEAMSFSNKISYKIHNDTLVTIEPKP